MSGSINNSRYIFVYMLAVEYWGEEKTSGTPMVRLRERTAADEETAGCLGFLGSDWLFPVRAERQ